MSTAKVAEKNYFPRIGEQVFSMGCNLGNNPTCMSGGIATINRYLGENNFEVSGRPEQGRSGGGLFNSEGKLIGVLNSAIGEENAGLYGGINFIHKYLDSLGLSDLYKLILAMFIKTQ